MTVDESIETDDDPEYRIAYDVDRCKVGCVLIQAALACSVPSAIFYDYFGTGDAWTVDARGCKIYPIRRSQLPLLAARTSFEREGDKDRSAFRFVPSNRSGQYSVWRVDQRLGHVTKIVHRISDRGVTRTIVAGWTPSTPDRIDLATATTREAAAKALWAFHQASQ